MGMDAILVLQGGGALGAYECGVYKALVPHFKRQGYSLSVVAGTSIGAINASVIASRYKDEDCGVRALEELWTQRLATPSLPFFPPLPVFESYSAVWTDLLLGNRHLFTPYFFGWNFLAPIVWGGFTQFYDTGAMRKTLTEVFAPSGNYRGAEPRLIVTAVDVQNGLLEAFDSGQEAVTVDDVMASCALPPWFPEESHDGRHFWDGGLSSNTPLREALNTLQQSNTALGSLSDEYHVFIVSLFPRESVLPKTNWELWSRINQITFGDKTEFEQKATDVMNSYLLFVKTALGVAAQELPAVSPLRQLVEQEAHKLKGQKRMRLDITRIQRQARPEELISREIDFSPRQIEALISQGYRDACDELKQTELKESSVARLAAVG
jgi:NTE family protein